MTWWNMLHVFHACAHCQFNRIGLWHLIVQFVFRHEIHQCFILNQIAKGIACSGRKFGILMFSTDPLKFIIYKNTNIRILSVDISSK